MPLNFGGQKRSGAFDTVWPSAKNFVPPGQGSLKTTRPRMCAVVLGKIARIRSNPDPPDKRHLTRRNADRCPVGVVWGPFGSRFVAQRAPNRLKSTPTRPPTTSKCSRMSCCHQYHAEVLAQGLASLSTLHISPKPMRKKTSHNKCSTIACGPFCSHKDV